MKTPFVKKVREKRGFRSAFLGNSESTNPVEADTMGMARQDENDRRVKAAKRTSCGKRLIDCSIPALAVIALLVLVGCEQEANRINPSASVDTPDKTDSAVPASSNALESTQTANLAVTAAQEEFRKLFVRLGDSYYSQLPGGYNPTIIGDWKAKTEIEERKGVEYSCEEFQVSEAEKLNGIAGKGKVTFSSTVRRRFFPRSGWTQWRDRQPMVEVDYVLYEEDVSTEVYADERNFWAPSADQLRNAGISVDSESYWKHHLNEQLETALNQLQKTPPESPEKLAATWLEFLNQWGTTQNPFSTKDEELLLAAQTNYAKAMQQWWLAIYQDESKKPEFRGVTPKAKSAQHAHFLEMQKVVFGDGSGLLAQFPKLPSFTNSIGITLVWCPPTTEDDKSLPGFWISESEITELQWSRLTGVTTDHPDLPIRNISWQESVDFCEKLTAFEQKVFAFPTQLKYSLPRKKTWERACFAGAEKRTDRPDNLTELGWFEENSNGEPHAVKSKAANPFGIFDMRGNVAEWVVERGTYGRNEGRDLARFKGDSFRDSIAEHSPRGTSSFRGAGYQPSTSAKSAAVGFRIVIQP